MKPIICTAVSGLAAVLVSTGTATATPSTTEPHIARAVPGPDSPHAMEVALAPRPGTEADQLARQLMARELERAKARGENPLVLVGMTRLGKAHDGDVLFVQIQSVDECGSAGCTTVSFRKAGQRWIRIMDTVGGTVRIAASHHRGMPDLIVQDGNRLIWDGSKYATSG